MEGYQCEYSWDQPFQLTVGKEGFHLTLPTRSLNQRHHF